MPEVIHPKQRKSIDGDLRPQEVCKICGGTGYIYNAESNSVIFCECYKREMNERKFRFANIPGAYKDLRLDTFRVSMYRDQETIRQAVKYVKYYLEHLDSMIRDGYGLYLYSKCKGSGKTRMATGIANELIHKHNITVRFATSMEIIASIKSSWDKESDESENKLMSQLTNAPVLVIDDFGTETHRDWLDDKFYTIVNTRYVNKLVTIYTSNLSLNNLKYDERITSRIKERVYQIPFPEESVRDLIAENMMNDIRKAVQNE